MRPGAEETVVVGDVSGLPEIPGLFESGDLHVDGAPSVEAHRSGSESLPKLTQCGIAKAGPGDSAEAVWRSGGCRVFGGQPHAISLKSFDFPPSKMDIRRSFTQAEWAHVLTTVEAQSIGPARLRLKCILELLVTSGIRLDELAKARHKDQRIESLPDLPETWILTVTGKRNKTREVPLNPDVGRLLALHGGEFVDEDKGASDKDNLPLIRTLGASVPQWKRGDGGELVVSARSEKAGSALSAPGI